MKIARVLWAALLLCALTACQRPDKPSPSPPQMLEPLPAVPSAPAPSAPPEEKPAYSVVLPDGVPERIVFDAGEIGTRYYPETTLALLPSPDYGRLYPFVGAATKWDYIWSGVQLLYGLCTADGRIVVDPVYNSTEIVEKDGNAMYMLQRIVNHRYETTFAALDGSWAAAYQDNDRRPMLYDAQSLYLPPKPDYISVYDGKGWGAIDYKGNLVYPCRERFPVQFCEGLAAVWDETGEYITYIDIEGNAAFGCQAPERLDDAETLWKFGLQNVQFSHGLARIKQGELWGYADKTGKIVIEPQFHQSSAFYGGYTVVADANYRIRSAIDRAGNVLVSVGSGVHIEPLDETLFWVHDWNTNDHLLMNSSGDLMPMSIIPDRRLQNGWWAARSGEEHTVLEKDGEVIGLPYHGVNGLPDDKFLLHDYTGDTYWAVADKSGTLLGEWREGYAWMLPSGRIQSYCQWNRTTVHGLWDADLTPILPVRYEYLAEFGDFFAVRDGYYGGLLDSEGHWVVKRSLLDSMLD